MCFQQSACCRHLFVIGSLFQKVFEQHLTNQLKLHSAAHSKEGVNSANQCKSAPLGGSSSEQCAVLCSGDEKELFGGARLLRLGGHFPGSAVLHWSAGAGGKGVLCTGQPLANISHGHAAH